MIIKTASPSRRTTSFAPLRTEHCAGVPAVRFSAVGAMTVTDTVRCVQWGAPFAIDNVRDTLAIQPI